MKMQKKKYPQILSSVVFKKKTGLLPTLIQTLNCPGKGVLSGRRTSVGSQIEGTVIQLICFYISLERKKIWPKRSQNIT